MVNGTATHSSVLSSMGVKALMAVSGVIMSGWMMAHVAGNLTVFAGAETINGYAHKLREVPALLWTMRVGMLSVLAVHVSSAVFLIRRNRHARGTGYRQQRSRRWAQSASRSMGLTGGVMFLLLLYHLLHIYGPLHPDYIATDVHHNLIVGVRAPLHGALYFLMTVLLGIHLHHGLWSTLRTLGLTGTSRLDRWLDRGSYVIAGAITIGFLIPLFAILFHVL